MLLSTALRLRLCSHAPSFGERFSDQQRNPACKCPSHTLYTPIGLIVKCFLSCCCFNRTPVPHIWHVLILSRSCPAGAQ